MAIFTDVSGDVEQKSLRAKHEEENVSHHLSEGDIAALMDTAVLAQQRRVMLAHLANCKKCRTILSGAILSQSFVSDPG
jgi:hypothetical protein